MLLKQVSSALKGPSSNTRNMSLWAWVNMMFNRVDPQRVKMLGPERAATEWLLRNGASVRYEHAPSILQSDYNQLPDEKLPFKYKIREIDGSDSGIMGLGFEHLRGCTNVQKIRLHNCVYLYNDALKTLSLVKESLRELEVSKCKHITDEGLLSLKDLYKLEKLIAFELPKVKDMNGVRSSLHAALPNCELDLR